MVELKNTTRKRSHSIQPLSRESKPGPSEWEAKVYTT